MEIFLFNDFSFFRSVSLRLRGLSTIEMALHLCAWRGTCSPPLRPTGTGNFYEFFELIFYGKFSTWKLTFWVTFRFQIPLYCFYKLKFLNILIFSGYCFATLSILRTKNGYPSQYYPVSRHSSKHIMLEGKVIA